MIHSNDRPGRLTKGTYSFIVNDVCSELKLDDTFTFSYQACMMCIYHGKENDYCKNTPLLLKGVEEKFVQIILCLADIGSPVTDRETICLMQSLIEGTPAQQQLIQYQKKIVHSQGHYELSQNSFGKIIQNYYYGFMK